MNKEKLEKYFYSIFDTDLHISLERWQIARVKTMVIKAIKKGNNIAKQKYDNNNA